MSANKRDPRKLKKRLFGTRGYRTELQRLRYEYEQRHSNPIHFLDWDEAMLGVDSPTVVWSNKPLDFGYVDEKPLLKNKTK